MAEMTQKIINEKPWGYSGLEVLAEQIITGEWITDLQYPQLHQTIEYMRTEAIISALEKAYIYPITQAGIQFYYDDKSIELDPEKKFQIDFIKSQFQNLPMPAILRNILTMLPHGFSVQEIIWDTTGEYLGISDIQPRKQSTIDKWKTNERGNLESITQYVYQPGENGDAGVWSYTAPIPVEKLLITTHEMENDNYRGRSLYRPIYREWKIKDFIMKQIAIIFERVGVGIPVALVGQNGKDGQKNSYDIDAIEAVLRGFQQNQRAYGVLDGVDSIQLLSIDGGVIDSTREFITYLDETIAKSLLQLWLNLGTSESGSRSLGETFQDLYYQSLDGIISEIENAINEQIIKRVCKYNWGEQSAYPKISIELDRDYNNIYRILAELKTAGIIQGNADMENWILNNFGLPLTDNTNRLNPEAGGAGAQPKESATPELSEHSHNCIMQLSDKNQSLSGDWTPRRKPTTRELEAGVKFDDIASELNTYKNELANKMRRIIEPAMIGAARELGKGTKFYKLEMKWGNKLADLYRKAYRDITKIAEADVKKELSRQGKINASEVLLAELIPWEENAWSEYLDEKANLESEIMRAKSLERLGRYYDGALAMQLVGTALANHIIEQVQDEIGAIYQAAAGEALLTYAGARELTAEQFKDTFDVKIRTTMFDNNVCEACAAQDGAEYTNSNGEWLSQDGEPAPSLPDANCDSAASGASRCRCIYIYTIGGNNE